MFFLRDCALPVTLTFDVRMNNYVLLWLRGSNNCLPLWTRYCHVTRYPGFIHICGVDTPWLWFARGSTRWFVSIIRADFSSETTRNLCRKPRLPLTMSFYLASVREARFACGCHYAGATRLSTDHTSGSSRRLASGNRARDTGSRSGRQQNCHVAPRQ